MADCCFFDTAATSRDRRPLRKRPAVVRCPRRAVMFGRNGQIDTGAASAAHGRGVASPPMVRAMLDGAAVKRFCPLISGLLEFMFLIVAIAQRCN